MKKRYFYEFSGTIFFEAPNQSHAEKAVTGKLLNDYLIDERVFEVDEYYVSHDLKIRASIRSYQMMDWKWSRITD